MGARHRNTILQLRARFDVRPLVARLEENGLVRLREPSELNGVWSAVLKAELDSEKPSKITESLLSSIEALEGEFRVAWDECLLRQFANSYVARSDGLVSTHAITNDHLNRLASAGLTLRIVVGPDVVPQ